MRLTEEEQMELTLEQQFNLKLFEAGVAAMSREELQKHTLDLIRQLYVKENFCKQLINEKIGAVSSVGGNP